MRVCSSYAAHVTTQQLYGETQNRARSELQGMTPED